MEENQETLETLMDTPLAFFGETAEAITELREEVTILKNSNEGLRRELSNSKKCIDVLLKLINLNQSDQISNIASLLALIHRKDAETKKKLIETAEVQYSKKVDEFLTQNNLKVEEESIVPLGMLEHEHIEN